MQFIDIKTSSGKNKGEISYYCKCLEVSIQAFYKYIKNKIKPDKHYEIKNMILSIKDEDLFKRNFSADKPYEKLVTDITEIPVLNKKLYVSAIFDCYSLKVLGISIKDNMKTDLVIETLKNAYITHPMIRGAILHSDRGSVYTSYEYREQLKYYGIIQSMNSDGGRCHDNASCESMHTRMKEELLYNRYQTINMNFDNVKQLIWRYYISYWNNRRICSAIGGIPPIAKEKQYYDLINKNNNDIA